MTVRDKAQILLENKRRYDCLHAPYNPYTGEGSAIERMPLRLKKDGLTIYLPIWLWNTPTIQEVVSCKTLYAYAKKKGLCYEDALDWLNDLRLTFDLEYYCACCVHIKDKLSGKDMLFVLNHPQQILAKALQEILFLGKPVLIIIDKARQWGCSTLIENFYGWIIARHKKNWNVAIAAHLQSAAKNIRAMLSYMAKHLPKDVCDFELKSFEGTQQIKVVPSRGSTIAVASIKNPDALRSGDIKLAHLSEVGLWQDNNKIKGDDLAQDIIASVPHEPFCAVIMESTAKGLNYFWREWMKSIKGESGFKPIFIAWFQIPIYCSKFRDDAERMAFIDSMTEIEWERWNLGATLEGLKWYREKLATMPSAFRMMQEFPSSWQESFSTTGRYVHNVSDINALRKGCREPQWKGSIVATKQYGQECLGESMHFVESLNGDLWVWKKPDTDKNVLNRYIVSVDIGGRSDDSDWSVISVIDRYPLLFGGCEECIATWRFHLDHDLTAWRAAQIAKWYNNALLVVEVNSLETVATEGDHTLTILDTIVEYYPNIYFRDDPTKVREGLAPHYGYHTGRAEKVDIVAHWQFLLRERLVVERDSRVLDEVQNFEQKDRRDTYGAVEGEHDDMYMSRGIGLKVSSKWDLPKEVEFDRKEGIHRDVVVRTV